MKSKFNINFSVKISVSIVTGHTHSTNLKNFAKTNYKLVTNVFYKIQLNYAYCDFIYCPATVLHGIYHNKYRLYEFKTFHG